MKLYARLADMSDIEYLKNNNMYQTAVKYMSILNELGLLRCRPWTQTDNGNASDNVVTVIAFRQVDADEEDIAIAAECYHPYNNEEYMRLPYKTDKDIALTFVNERHRGDVSFIFHENYTGEYNEVRFLSGDWSRGRPRVLLGEI
jgi:hypothetical protein